MSHDDEEVRATVQRLSVYAATVQQNPLSTIEPPTTTADENERRAMEVLAQVASGATGLAIERTLGEGGMGIVRLATQVALGRKVAVKSLKNEARDPRSTLRLLREAWITGTLEHPNVVPVYDLGVDETGGPRLVLKRIEGTEWAALINDARRVGERFNGRALLEWNLSIFQQVAQAVHFAHSRGIVHRDLKPENVMIGSFGEVYVLDWGIAVALNDDGSGRMPLAADAHDMAGTPSYMAPEMLGGEKADITVRTDVYLLGALLYEILTRRPPHVGTTIMDYVRSIMTSQLVFPDGSPGELVRICRRAMAPDPEARFDNVEQLRLAVQGFLQHDGSRQLAREAARRFDELRGQLALPKESIDREAMYNLFGAVRFGFQQALREWSDNEEARLGLREATLLVIEHELVQRDPRAAAALLSELSDAPLELTKRIADARRGQEEELARLVQAAGDFDPNTGRRTRSFLALVLGSIWTAAPLLIQFRSRSIDHGDWIRWSIGFLVLLALLGTWARETLSKTAFNRRIGYSTLFLFSGQLVLVASARKLGIAAATTSVVVLFFWFTIAAMVTLALEWRVAPTAAAYLGAFLVAVVNPGWAFYGMSAAGVVLTANLVSVWQPRDLALERIEAVRARLGRKKV